METIIKVIDSPTPEEKIVYTLERDFASDGGIRYFITRDQSRCTYIVGDTFSRTEIERARAEHYLDDIAKTTIEVCPNAVLGCDGRTTTIEIERGLNKVSFTWWEGLPEQWENLNTLFEIFRHEGSGVGVKQR
jgi:hypothetical protein